jgi:hypothetical protein
MSEAPRIAPGSPFISHRYAIAEVTGIYLRGARFSSLAQPYGPRQHHHIVLSQSHLTVSSTNAGKSIGE